MVVLSEDIIKYIIDFCDIPSLLKLSDVNKNIRTYINNKDWKQIWLQIIQNKKTALSEFEKKTTLTIDSDYKEIVRLAGFTGCMLCNKKNIRKVWWQFKIRSCTECLYERTIGEWEFEDKIPKDTYKDLPYTTKQMYNKYYRNYTIKFYWKPKIEELLLLYPPQPPAPSSPPMPPKQKRIKKEPTTQELENQTIRIEEINNICLLNNIVLNDAKSYSETYNKNIKITSKLQKKNFIDSKIPEITREIADKKEEIRLREIKLEEQRLENIRLTEQFNERVKIQKELYLMTKEDKRKKIANIMKNKPTNNRVICNKTNKCEVCNNNRLFCIQGLYDHKRDAHGII